MNITFLSDQDIKNCSSFNVNERFDLYDERFGSIKTNTKCTVCKKTESGGCYGHYGCLYLGVDLFHPVFYEEIAKAVNSVCNNCFLPFDSAVIKNVRSGIKCSNCENTIFTDYNIFPTQSYIIKRRYGNASFTPTECKFILSNHPAKKYIISYIIIPPTGIRPPEDVEWPSDISRLYIKIVDAVRLSNGSAKNLKKINELYNSIVGYFRKDGVIKALSGKQGIFRTLMLGKRLNRSSRLVIIGDPYLNIDEILVPYDVTLRLRISERVWTGNISLMKKYARENKLWWESEDIPALEDHVIVGKVYDRVLVNGDLVMFNRQPSLSKFSILAFKIKTFPGCTQNVFAFNPAVIASFNADFDGDEMNVYAGYGLEAKAELMELCYVTKNIYDPISKKVFVSPIQDIITGTFMMTTHVQLVDEKLYYQCITLVEKTRECKEGSSTLSYSTLDIISLAIPENVTYRSKDGKINILPGGVLHINTNKDNTYCVPITKDFLCKDIILYIGMNFGQDTLAKFIKNIQLVVIEWLNHVGFTLSLKNCVWSKEDTSVYDSMLPFVKTDYDVTQLQNWVLRKSIHEYHTNKSTNPLSIMLRSGSKGKDIGAVQMAVSLGQQYINGNIRPCINPASKLLIDNGFVKSSYVQGISPKEYFSQATTSLSGIIDIGTNVSSIGYANRRVSKLTADVVQNYNKVVSTGKQVIQFREST